MKAKQMQTILLKPRLNPAFKITQPLPLLPAGFVAKRAWAAKPLSEQALRAETFGAKASVSDRCTIRPRHEINTQSARLVA